MVDLKGDKFKSKRASYNGFIKHYDFECLPFSSKHTAECKKLYSRWMKERKNRNDDPIYRGMLEDSRASLTQALDHFSALGLVGKIVKVDKKIRGFTLGYALDEKTFCVLYEITDLSVRGLSQFIFREFCRSQEGFSYINIMDDSGLENLKRVKLSYHPIRIIPAYTASRDTLSANQGTPF
jgi:hypothetical protein